MTGRAGIRARRAALLIVGLASRQGVLVSGQRGLASGQKGWPQGKGELASGQGEHRKSWPSGDTERERLISHEFLKMQNSHRLCVLNGSKPLGSDEFSKM